MTDRFLICLPFTLAQEDPVPNDWNNPRNYSDTPGDSGGPTFNGITHTEYDIWRKQQELPTQDIRKMTQDEGYAIYRQNYWMPDCPNLPAGLDLQFFDTAVNMGSNRAVKLLQASLGLAADGDWGPLTQAAVVAITPATLPGIIKDETGLRLKTYQSFGGYREFGADWSRRDAEIGAEALKMVST